MLFIDFSHLQQRILLPPIVFLDLRFEQKQLKVSSGLALFTYRFVTLKVFFLLLHFVFT
jgi:hypothetical protein